MNNSSQQKKIKRKIASEFQIHAESEYRASCNLLHIQQNNDGAQKEIMQLFEVFKRTVAVQCKLPIAAIYPGIAKTIRLQKTNRQFSMFRQLCISFAIQLILWLLALSANSINPVSKQRTFKHITIEKGMSNNLVTTLCKDSLGYTWFGTSNGVNKYDGYSVSSYINIEDDSTNLIKNGVFSIILDSKGRLWVGKAVGLCYYIYNKNNFIRKTLNLNQTISNPFIGAMCKDKNGIIWIGTNFELILMNIESLEIEHFTLLCPQTQSYFNIRTLLLNSDHVWHIDTYENGFIRYNPQNNTYKQYISIPGVETSINENRIETKYQNLNGTIWIGTNHHRMSMFNLQKNLLHAY